MRIYLDSSAAVKRYVSEPDHELVLDACRDAQAWLANRIAFVEVRNALARSQAATQRFRREWPQYDIVELDAEIADRASSIATSDGLRSLDAIHLASAERAGRKKLVFATWDRRLWNAASKRGFEMLPEKL